MEVLSIISTSWPIAAMGIALFARADCEWNDGCSASHCPWRALDAPEPMAGAVEGWKLVPVEPTDEMCLAGSQDHEHMATTWGPMIRMFHAFQAMLAVSPPPPDGSAAARIERLEAALWEVIKEDQIAQYNGTTHIGYADGSRARIARTALGG